MTLDEAVEALERSLEAPNQTVFHPVDGSSSMHGGRLLGASRTTLGFLLLSQVRDDYRLARLRICAWLPRTIGSLPRRGSGCKGSTTTELEMKATTDDSFRRELLVRKHFFRTEHHDDATKTCSQTREDWRYATLGFEPSVLRPTGGETNVRGEQR